MLLAGVLVGAASGSVAQDASTDAFAKALRAGHVRVLGESVRRHDASVDCVAISRDGRQALSTGADGVIAVWDVATGKRVKAMEAETAIHFAYFAGDDVVALEGDGKIRFRSRATGEVVGTVDGIPSMVAAVAGNVAALEAAVSPDEKELVFATPGGRSFVRIDLGARERLDPIPAASGIAKAVAYTPDGKHLVLGEVKGLGGFVRVQERSTGETLHTNPAERMTRIAVTGDSKRFVVAAGRSFDVRSIADGRSIETLSGMGDPVTCLALDATGKRMWFGTALDTDALCVDIAAGQLAYAIREHLASVRGLALSPDGTRLLTGSADHTVRFWSAENGRLLDKSPGHVNRVDALVFSADGKTIASGGYGNRVVRSTVADGAVRVLGAHDAPVIGVAHTRSGAVVSAGMDNTIRLWDAERGAEPRAVKVEDDAPMSTFVLSPTGRAAAAGHFGPHARLWDTDSWKPTRVLRHPGDDVTMQCVAFSPDGTLVATGDSVGSVRVWRVESGEAVATLGSKETWISALEFIDAKRIAVGDGSGVIRVWSFEEKGPPKARALGEDQSVHAIAVAPDRTRYAVATAAAAHLFDAKTGAAIGRIDDFPSTISMMAFGPKSRRLAMGMFDSAILVWDLTKATLVTK